MANVIVLINCNLADEEQASQTLKKLGVFHAQVNGAYQFIAKVEGTPEANRMFIWDKIRKINGIRSTLTLAVTSSWIDTDD